MVSVIKTGHSIRRILNYNENKVKDGVAVCIGEGNYPVDADRMNFTMKLNLLLRQAELNGNVKRNSVHISLNFDPSENEMPKEKLMEIADAYMDKIGFGKQPYLVYQHFDAGHPHIHIVSVKVRSDGSRIDMNNIGKNQSEEARKEIEKSFGLIKAEGRRSQGINKDIPIPFSPVRYGKLESKKAIAKVLGNITSQYKYTSLAELNAVLRQYNILAGRGSENSRTFQKNGLVYRILDQQGLPVGVPIKASDFYDRPTLKFLESRFTENHDQRMPYRNNLKNAIDKVLLDKPLGIESLKTALEKLGIHMAVRQNDGGIIYGITFVDHRTMSVFNGSSLGKQYSAKAILERCGAKQQPVQKALVPTAQDSIGLQPQAKAVSAETKPPTGNLGNLNNGMDAEKLVDAFLAPEAASDFIPGDLKKKKKRKKKRNLNNR